MRDNPVVGIFAAPYINLNKNPNLEKKFVMVPRNLTTLLKKKNINYLIIPYNLNTKLYNNYLNNIDGLIISGTFVGNFEKNKEMLKQYKTFKLLLKKIIKINKTRTFPIYGNCNGYELVIKATENAKYNTDIFDMNFDAHKNYINFYNYKFVSNTKKYKKYNNRKVKYLFITAITPKKFKKTKKLKKNYKIISIGKDKNNKKFVDFIKHKTLPFYLFKSHPHIDNPKLFQKYIDELYKSNKIRKNKKSQTLKFKPKKMKYKTYKLNYLMNKKIPSKENMLLYKI